MEVAEIINFKPKNIGIYLQVSDIIGEENFDVNPELMRKNFFNLMNAYIKTTKN